MIEFEEFLQNRPLLHSWDGGKTFNAGGLYVALLQRIRDLLEEVPAKPAGVIETGAGCSTIAFLLMGCTPVVSIAPDPALWQRIEHYVAEHEIPALGLRKVVDFSEFVLPKLAADLRRQNKQLDLALIDGAHEYPTVFVDFCYMNSVLRKGGYFVIDDVQLHPPKELARCLARSSDFELAHDLGKTLIFRKTQDRPRVGSFSTNAYLRETSEFYAKQANPFALF
jgi:predicted O-methyltransferase YrrM